MSDPMLLSLPNAAKEIGVGYGVLYRLIKTGDLPRGAYIVCGRKRTHYYIKVAQVRAWIERGEIPR